MSVLSKLVAFVACVLLSLPAAAQEPTPEQREYSDTFQKGFDALQSGRHDEGIAAFRRCLELAPEDALSAYNVACGHSLKGEVDQAFAWLDKAADWGFGGLQPDNIEHARVKDQDLASLRSDPRFGEFIAKMTTMKTALDEYTGKAAVYVPSALAGQAEIPLLVVLHGRGSTKDQVIAGPWKQVADELGLALLAPSGKLPLGRDPRQGMAWILTLSDYEPKYWTFEKPVQDAVSAFKKEHKVDAARVIVAGEGEGGMLAANIALSGPGLYKGVLVVDGPIPSIAASKGPNAGKMGLRARFLLGRGGEALSGVDVDAFAASLSQQLTAWGVAGEVATFERAEGAPDPLPALLVTHIRALLPAGLPIEAGTTR